MAMIYALAGIMHFVKPRMYVKIIPHFFPFRRVLNHLAGIAEFVLAIGLLFKETRAIAALGIFLMLIIFLIVHFHMLKNKKASMGVPQWVLILRIPLQFILMWWAYTYI